MSDIADLVAEAREAEDETHTDTCRVERPSTDPGTWTPENGDVPAAPTTIYPELSCRVRQPGASDRAATVGEYQWQVGDAVLRLAAGTTGVRIGDLVTVTDSPQGVGLDGAWQVVWPIAGSHMSSARFIVRKAG